MFANKLFTISRAHISKSKRFLNVKSSKYYFHTKTKILANFQICISVPLKQQPKKIVKHTKNSLAVADELFECV